MLCAQIDVERRLQTTFTNQPEPVITALITAAQARIESFVGRKLESTTYTDEVYDPPRGSYPVHLRHWPVTDVTAVTVDGTALTVPDDIAFYESGMLFKVSDGLQVSWATSKRQSIEVTYVGGYVSPDHDTALELFRDVCAWMVANAFETGRQIAEEEGALAGVSREEIGDYTIEYASTQGVDLASHISVAAHREDLVRYRGLMVA